jgi:hypothetical protein
MRIDSTVLIPVLTLAAAIGLDWLAGIAVAVKAGTFQASKIPNQLESVVGPYLSPAAVAAMIQSLSNDQHFVSTPAITVAVIAMCASYTPRFISDAKDKWIAFAAGLPITPEDVRNNALPPVVTPEA